MKILIIEDEKYTAKDLSHTIKVVDPDVEILPFIHSVEDALAYLEQSPDIDLIFSDIDLGDGLSFEIFDKVSINCPIIFCTAYEQYTLQALQNFGIDYILKPFQKIHIEKALLKYKGFRDRFLQRNTHFSELKTALSPSDKQIQTLLVHQSDRIIPVAIEELAFIYTENNLVFAFTFTEKKYVLSEKLEVLEQNLPRFFRANRQYLINRNAIKDVSQYFNRKVKINLKVSYADEIIVSRLKVQDFLNWLANTV